MDDSDFPGVLTGREAERLLGLSVSTAREFAAVRSRASRITILAWGAAWFFGFGLIWLSVTTGVPGRGVALALFGAGCVAAFATTVALTRRASGEMSGRGRRDNEGLGLAWLAAILVSQLLAAGLYALGVDPEVVLLTIQPALVSVAIGLILVTFGLLRPAPLEAWMGALLLALGCAAPFVRAPGALALLSVGGLVMMVSAGAARRLPLVLRAGLGERHG